MKYPHFYVVVVFVCFC